MAPALCPYCDESVAVEDPELGDEVQCPECDINLSIISVEPLEFEEIGFDAGDDPDDDDEDEDDSEDDDESDFDETDDDTEDEDEE